MSRKSRKYRRKNPRIRRQTPPGAMPGTVKVDPAAPRPVIRVLAYGPDHIKEEQVDDPDQIKSLLGQYDVVWVNVDGLGDAETIRRLGDIFGLHNLALEDVVNVHQLAKVEDYGDHLFIVTRMVNRTVHLDTEQVSLFLGENYVLTFQERAGDCLDPLRQRIRKSRGRIRNTGADYLAYAILDSVVDNYFPVVDGYGEMLEALDERITHPRPPRNINELHRVRSDLMIMRRAIRPMRDALLKLMPDATPLVSQETLVYIRDCYDHTVQLIDLLDTYRELCSDLRDFYLSTISQRLNEVMKVLTIIATIFIPLTFIAGVYGMNFSPESSPWNMPELRWTYGYPLALAAMLTIAVLMLVYFRRKGWIGSQNEALSLSPPASKNKASRDEAPE